MILDARLALPAAGLALLWAAAIAMPTLRGPGDLFEALERTFFDWRVLTFGPWEPPADIVIVALDDATRAASTVGEERRQLAAVVETLSRSGARVLAVDILLTDSGPAEFDARLGAAFERLPTVVAGAAGSLATGGRIGIPRAAQELWPQASFQQDGGLGLANIITGRSGLPRYVPTIFSTSRGILPSLALRSAATFGGVEPELTVGTIRLGTREMTLDHSYLLPLRPYGPAGSIPMLSALEVLSEEHAPSLAGKLVVLGHTATGLGDRFPSPFGGSVTGVEVIATAIGHFLEPRQVLIRSPATRRIDAAVAAGVAVAATLSVLAMPLALGLTVAGLLGLATLAAVWIAFSLGIWLAAALPLFAIVGPVALAAIWRYARERRQAVATDRAMNELKKFQSPQLARLVEADPSFLSSPKTSQATILFVDLAGFTAMSQSLGPEGTEGLLKRFHRRVTRIVHDQGGLVFNYMGDGALAAFGLLEEQARADHGAIAAAFELVETVRLLHEDARFRGKLSCRVALHFGTVILSRLGDDLQQQISVSGDSVNLTSRLLEVAKAHRASIAATAETVHGTNLAGIRPPDARRTVTLRGRHGEVEVALWRS